VVEFLQNIIRPTLMPRVTHFQIKKWLPFEVC